MKGGGYLNFKIGDQNLIRFLTIIFLLFMILVIIKKEDALTILVILPYGSINTVGAV